MTPARQARAEPSGAGRVALIAALVVTTGACDSRKEAGPGQPPSAAAASSVSSSSSSSATMPGAMTAPSASSPMPGLPIGPGGANVVRPASGVFGPGEADAIAKRGEPRRVVVLDAGAEPRETIAYRAAPGTKQTITMGLDLAMAMSPPGAQPRLMKMPRTETTLQISTESAEADKATVRAEIVAVQLVETDASQAAAISGSREMLETLKGINLEMTFDPRATHTAVSLASADKPSPEASKALEQLRQTLFNVITPTPDVPVGTGARWLVVERIATPADVIQIRTVTLGNRDGTRAELTVSVAQIAAAPRLGPAAAAGGASPTIGALETSGTSTFSVDFEHVCPDKGQSEVKTVMLLTQGKDSLRTEAVAKATIETR